MTKTPVTAALLKQLAADKKRYGVHPCCYMLVTGPHSSECPVEHDIASYYRPPTIGE